MLENQFPYQNALPTIQYDFSADGGRSNQLLSLINNSQQTQQMTGIHIITNADIQNPWQILGQEWKNVKKEKLDTLHYSYRLEFTKPISLLPGENKMLEYSISDGALGPISNASQSPKVVNFAPKVVEIESGGKWNPLTWVASNDPQPNPHPTTKFKIYHANWGQYQYKRTIEDEQFNAINSLVYAFIGFDEQGNIFSLDTWGDQLELLSLQEKKAKYPDLKVSLGFGGWTNENQRMNTVFSKMAANADARKKFITNAVNALLLVGANGIDIDWEYVSTQDANNFITLLEELRQAMKEAHIADPQLSIAAPAGADNIHVFSKAQWARIADQVDDIAIMAYDYYGGFSQYSDFHAPMKLSPHSPNFKNGDYVEKTLSLYNDLGIPSEKLSLGIPNYTRGVIVENPGPFAGLYQPVVGSPRGDFGSPGGVFSWDTIWKFLHKQPSQLGQLGVKEWYYYDSNHELCKDAQMCMLSGQLPDGRWVMINFLDQACAKARAEYAIKKGLGGVMLWANYESTEQPENSIIQAVSSGLPQDLKSQENHGELTQSLKGKLIAHKDKLAHAFFAQKKHNALEQLIQNNDLNQIETLIKQHRNDLIKHRNIFKRGLVALLPTSWHEAIIDKPKSFVLAETYLKVVKRITPTKIISNPVFSNDHSYAKKQELLPSAQNFAPSAPTLEEKARNFAKPNASLYNPTLFNPQYLPKGFQAGPQLREDNIFQP